MRTSLLVILFTFTSATAFTATEPDYAKAGEWLEKAVANNDLRAGHHLGLLLREGKYDNREVAIPALVKGTELGFRLAMTEITGS